MRDLLFPKAADWHLLIPSWWMAFSELADVLGMHQFQRISVIPLFCLQIPLFLLCWCRRFMKRLVTVEGNRFFHAFERSFGLLVVMLSLVEFSNHVCFVGATLAVPCNRKWLTCLRIVWSQINPLYIHWGGLLWSDCRETGPEFGEKVWGPFYMSRFEGSSSWNGSIFGHRCIHQCLTSVCCTSRTSQSHAIW